MTTPELPIPSEAVESLMRDAADQFIIPRYNNLADGDIDCKTSATDQVTIADREAEVFLQKELTALLPDSLFVGEELAHREPQTFELLKEKDKFIWVVDPLDGTRSFITGVGEFGVMVALVYNEVAIGGWIYDIVNDRMIMQTGDAPTLIDGSAVPFVTKKTGSGGVNRQVASMLESQDIPDEFMPFYLNKPSVGFYQQFLNGEVDYLALYKVNPWDHYMSFGMVLSQGAVITDWLGNPFSFVDNYENGILISRDQETSETMIKNTFSVLYNANHA